MSNWLIWIAAAIAVLVVASALVEAYLKRNTRRRLSEMRPDPAEVKRVAAVERSDPNPVEAPDADEPSLEDRNRRLSRHRK
ncbi:hypothetical protein AVO45_02320 [Ruegeria marisrubri]|uniref:Uncharacterized protein n=1 Tax=Ruegeria marisrubri TaxID=1685379 RepID=A0A101CYW0_9RHOB|nr:hypothetical protein [Ruegeria marisrubri]KUJ85835.1 hypothetical protein AVO45_02320 [Ruegeria marisrubri]